jgi:hypothetical protein
VQAPSLQALLLPVLAVLAFAGAANQQAAYCDDQGGHADRIASVVPVQQFALPTAAQDGLASAVRRLGDGPPPAEVLRLPGSTAAGRADDRYASLTLASTHRQRLGFAHAHGRSRSGAVSSFGTSLPPPHRA